METPHAQSAHGALWRPICLQTLLGLHGLSMGAPADVPSNLPVGHSEKYE